jgi:tRNA 5-methylaminomethyl-2-thiouridine biosynthesis bifunctional protein
MRRDNSPWRAATAAALEWSEQGDPRSRLFGDVYYSRENGLAESRHVFLLGNALPQRWLAHQARHFCIAETGFGTGLNFLLTWQAWRQLPSSPHLHFVSLERYPLAREDMARALAAWPELGELAQVLLEQYPGLQPGQHRLVFEKGRLTLDLWWEDVADVVEDLACRAALVDAWYLDGFAPARNEAMWQAPLFRAMAAASRPGATFATFTAAGHVRRGLEEAGFAVEKVPGYGRKRECLRGRLRACATAWPVEETPWDLDGAATRAECHAQAAASVLVLGGGLAGCAAAAALARRGIAVTILEQGNLAGAGSGNDQGILYTRLSRKHSALTDFALLSFAFASRYYRTLLDRGLLREGIDGALCGYFQQDARETELEFLAEALLPVPELAQVLDADRASGLLGVSQDSDGLWYPASGWLRPASVCRALAAQVGIRVIEGCGELALDRGDDEWRAMAGTTVVAAAPCAVVATGTAATRLPQLDWLPLQSIRGQTTHLPASTATRSLRAALCHEGYIAPARENVHCIGATFDLHDTDDKLRAADHRANLASLGAAVPGWRSQLEALDPGALAGRVGYRCASPDYLPLVGPVPDREAFLRTYAPLRRNARRVVAEAGTYLPGLYLTTAHGSRGLASAPLSAELLASQICGEPLPLSRGLCRALAPARFIIRDLSRHRI